MISAIQLFSFFSSFKKGKDQKAKKLSVWLPNFYVLVEKLTKISDMTIIVYLSIVAISLSTTYYTEAEFLDVIGTYEF
jgi:hypothetical protein